MTDTYGGDNGDGNGASGRPITRQRYIGPRVRSRSTGAISVWNGTRYVPETAQSLAPEAQEQIARVQTELGTDNQAVRYANEFLQFNRNQATGAPWHGHLPFQDENKPIVFNNPDMQSMVNLQNRFVRGNIQQGTSGAGNTGPEQTRIERSGPSVSNLGPANRAITLNLQIDRDLRARQLSEMQRWARDPRHRSLEGFDQWWAVNQGPIRAQIQRGYEATNGSVTAQADRYNRQRPNPSGGIAGAIAGRAGARHTPQRPRNVPNHYVWNARERTWDPPR